MVFLREPDQSTEEVFAYCIISSFLASRIVGKDLVSIDLRYGDSNSSSPSLDKEEMSRLEGFIREFDTGSILEAGRMRWWWW